MLALEHIQLLKKRKNLLAFSAGVDSTALFHLLLSHDIPFDIAIVDYNTRPQSKQEVAYAKELAKRYNLHCHLHTANKIETNFESNARHIRYTFFESLIKRYNYDTLLTAHHLGDRLEWFLMQLCKGAGCSELAGMRGVEKREGYELVRPLLHVDKEELKEYLQKQKIPYFEDATNTDTKYLRNFFRIHYATPLLQRYKEGIKRSFEYIDEDRALLEEECSFSKEGALVHFHTTTTRAALLCLDRFLKTRGYTLTASEKRLFKEKQTLVAGRKFFISHYNKETIITPYSQEKPTLPKPFKEWCRKAQIPPLLRPFLYQDSEALEWIKTHAPKG